MTPTPPRRGLPKWACGVLAAAAVPALFCLTLAGLYGFILFVEFADGYVRPFLESHPTFDYIGKAVTVGFIGIMLWAGCAVGFYDKCRAYWGPR